VHQNALKRHALCTHFPFETKEREKLELVQMLFSLRSFSFVARNSFYYFCCHMPRARKRERERERERSN
jgi:hypothetical protein